jgi:hypothetical protein
MPALILERTWIDCDVVVGYSDRRPVDADACPVKDEIYRVGPPVASPEGRHARLLVVG